LALLKDVPVSLFAEPVFVNVYGAQESIPRNRLRPAMWSGGPVRQIGLLYRPARLGSILGLHKRFTNTVSVYGFLFLVLVVGRFVVWDGIGARSKELFISWVGLGRERKRDELQETPR
jgi:hypothetical protein